MHVCVCVCVSIPLFVILHTFVMQLDMLSLFPLDLMYFVPALKFEALLRLPRLLKASQSIMFQLEVYRWLLVYE